MGDLKFIFSRALELTIILLGLWYGFVILTGMLNVIIQYIKPGKVKNITPNENTYIKQHQKLVKEGYDTKMKVESVQTDDGIDAEIADRIFKKKKKKKNK